MEDGYYLERLRHRLNERAGIVAQPTTTGPLRGNLDEDGSYLQGWAQDAANPEAPVELEILHAGQVVAKFLANRYCWDLRRAQLGTGNHGFNIPRPALPGPLQIRRTADGAILAAATAQRC